MKVALILERLDLSLGGAERSTWEIAQQLRRIGIETTLLSAVSSQSSDFAIALCGCDPNKKISFSAYQKAVQKYLADNPHDLIHSTLPFDFVDIYHPMGGSYKESYLRNASSYPGTLMPLWKRQTHFLNRRRTVYMKAEVQLCRRERISIAALSAYVKRQFIDHYEVSDERIHLIPNGVEVNICVSSEAVETERKKIFQALQIRDQARTTILLFGANNFRLKGLGDLLSAMAAYRRAGRESRLTLLIAGTENPKPWLKQAHNLGIERDIWFYGYTKDIHPLLSVIDAAVLPSYYDPCSRYILEALSMGKPVLTTRYNGASEYYQHLRHGIILDSPRHQEDFVKGLIFLSQPKNQQAAAEAINQDRLIDKLSIENHCRTITEMYHRILKR